MKCLTNSIVFVSAVLLICGMVFGAFAPRETYPPAAEDPVADGMFTTVKEYIKANIVPDDLMVGNLYMQQRQDWKVNGITYPGTTFFINHYFYDPGYGQLDMYDLNSWKVQFKNHSVEIWVFLSGNHPDNNDWKWLDTVGIGIANYPAGINDNGGFLVRKDDDPNTDVLWLPGDHQPGDPAFDFNDYHGAFGYGGFNSSAFSKGYSTENLSREMYEFVFNINIDPNDPDPLVEEPLLPCLHKEKQIKWVTVKDWKPSMGGYGVIGGDGNVPITDYKLMYDASLHVADNNGIYPGCHPVVFTSTVTSGGGQRKLGGLASSTPSVYTGINQYGCWLEHLDFNDTSDDINLSNGQGAAFDVPFNSQRYTISWYNSDGREVRTDFTMPDEVNLAHFQCSSYYGDYSIDYDVNDWTDANNYMLPPIGYPGTLNAFGHIAGGQYDWITFYQGKEIIRDPNGNPTNARLVSVSPITVTFTYKAVLSERTLDGDLNRDGKVNMFDLADFATQWLEAEKYFDLI
ncbi:MAG: hypothetical protein WCE45_09505 [Sedimentisphaerales bacterium]